MTETCKTLLYAADIGALREKSKFEAVYGLLDEARREQIKKYKKEDDAIRSAAAGFLLRLAMLENEINPDTAEIECNQYGKPYIKGKEDFCFNLSHARDIVLCAVSSSDVGCDVQDITEVKLQIARRFTKAEYALIMAQKDEQAQRDMLFRCWVMKESYIKAVGTGLQMPLNSFGVELESQESIHTAGDVTERKLRLREFEIRKGYKCAICTAAADLDKAELRWISF